MACKKVIARSLLTMLMISEMLTATLPAHADSTVIDGPGFKIEKKKGWFGRKSTSYTDALGNTVEHKTGWFGRQSERTKLFGSETIKQGKNISVTGPGGKPLITEKHTLFGGRQTHVDGNGIVRSFKDLFTP